MSYNTLPDGQSRFWTDQSQTWHVNKEQGKGQVALASMTCRDHERSIFLRSAFPLQHEEDLQTKYVQERSNNRRICKRLVRLAIEVT